MVIKKPYAFLIKHFRLIHLLITIFLGFIAYKNRELYQFLNDCISNSGNKYMADEFINYGLIIYIFLAMLLNFIVYWLLKYKDKPRNIYVISIVGYIVVSLVILLTYSYIGSFSNNIIEQKTIRMYRDIMFMTNIFQYFIVIIMFIRGLGFNIKKFNFSKDFQEMNINVDDSEEVEVNLELNSNKIMRIFRKRKREFGYYIKEYKILIIGITLIIFIIFCNSIYKYYNKNLKTYKELDYVGISNYISISESYYDVVDNNTYIILKFNIFNNGKSQEFNLGNMVITYNGNNYQADKNICKKYGKLGNCYKKQYITNEQKEYLAVYKLKDINKKKVYVMYSDGYDNKYKIKLNLLEYK